ncbi:MAG: alkene reductase [Rickettsiales bacterium]|nr:alkene reductase [Rickettsiales bacterium]
MSTLFEPTKVGAIEVKNRVFMAPLTRNRAQANGVPGDLAATYYAQRASAGLIISEATQISPLAKGYINTPGIYTDEQVEGWEVITNAVHTKGGKIVLQLWHVGRISHTDILPEGEQPLAPSAIRANAQTVTENGRTDVSEPRAMTEEDIRNTIADYKHAAHMARKAGFDGVEIHAANGYLIDQFIDASTNTREDAYGGSVENRLRLLKEVTDVVTEVWGAERVGVRLSPTGTFNDMNEPNPLSTYGAAIEMLNSYGLAYLHFVERFPGLEVNNADLLVLQQLRARWNGFYLANGDYDLLSSQDTVDSGHADAVAFGRPFIANPDLPERLERGAALNEPDHDTFYGGGAEGYTDYPFMNEAEAA